MKRFTIQTKYILLILLALINIAIRFPVTRHAIDIDTFYIFGLAQSISTFGFAGWIIHPTSFFGVYPFSYPSALMFVLSGLSQSSGISIEYIILLIGIVFGLFSAFSMFILAKKVWDNDMYAFIAAFTFSISPNFLVMTYWQATTRNIFLAFFPIFIWVLLKLDKSERKFLFLSGMFLILLAASHRVSFLLPLIIIAYCAAVIIDWSSKKINLKILDNPAVLQVHIFYIFTIISFFLFIVQFLGIGPFDVKDYYTGFFFNGEDFLSTFMNMAIDYASKVGLIFMFMIPGYILLAGKANKRLSEIFIIFSVMIFLPLMGFENYSPIFIEPFFILVSAMGLVGTYQFLIKKKTFALLIIAIFTLGSILFAFYMLSHWNMPEKSASDLTYNSAQFIKLYSNGSVISNNGDLASKITSYSTKPTIPLGGPYAMYQPSGQIAFGFVAEKELITRPLSLSELSPKVDEFWVASNAPNAMTEWVTIIENNYWDEKAKNMLSKYNANLIIELGETGNYLYWKQRYSRMLASLHGSGNNVFSNGQESIYSVDFN